MAVGYAMGHMDINRGDDSVMDIFPDSVRPKTTNNLPLDVDVIVDNLDDDITEQAFPGGSIPLSTTHNREHGRDDRPTHHPEETDIDEAFITPPLPTDKEYHTMFSFQSEDRRWVRKIHAKLESEPYNLKCCISDRDFHPGKEVITNIEVMCHLNHKYIYIYKYMDTWIHDKCIYDIKVIYFVHMHVLYINTC